jgi:hypothetical protein
MTNLVRDLRINPKQQTGGRELNEINAPAFHYSNPLVNNLDHPFPFDQLIWACRKIEMVAVRRDRASRS